MKNGSWAGLGALMATVKNGNGTWWKWALGAMAGLVMFGISYFLYDIKGSMKDINNNLICWQQEGAKERGAIKERLARMEEKIEQGDKADVSERSQIRSMIDELKKSLKK